MSGFALAAALAGDPAAAGVPVLIVTGHTACAAATATASALGVRGYVPKPFRPAELLEAVRRHLAPAPARSPAARPRPRSETR